MTRMLRRAVLAFALAGALVGGAFAQTSPAHSTFAAPPTTTDLGAYTPIAVAPGALAPRPLAVAGPGDRTIAADALAKAQAYSDSLGGHALLIWQGGKLRYERYGADVSAETRFETFSMHKSVLGLVYGAALRDGVIRSLDDTVGEHLPEWRGDPRGAISLRQLLTMESGLGLSHGDSRTELALKSSLDVPPGSRFEYNNVNSQIAGVILNRALKAGGQGDYAAYLSRVLLKPIGAGDAHLWLDKSGGDPRFYAYCEMRARDWLRVGMLIAHGGRVGGEVVLPAPWIKAMSTPSPLNPNYGLQLWIGSPWSPERSYGPRNPLKVAHAEPYPVSDLVFFDGFGGERVYVSPSLDLVIVRIGESSLKFDDSVLPNAVIAGLRRKGG